VFLEEIVRHGARANGNILPWA